MCGWTKATRKHKTKYRMAQHTHKNCDRESMCVCVCDWKRENFEIAHLDHFFSSTLNIHHSGFHRQSVTFFLNAITHNLLKHMFNGDYSAPEKLSCHRNLNNMSTQRLMECMDTSYIYNELTNYRIHTHTQ